MGDGSLQVVTFGCRLNAYESEQVRAQAVADGVTDAVVFNTCAVTAEAVRQARQAIRKARRERPGARLVVTGCAAQIDPGSFAAMPEVDLVLGNAEKAEPGALATMARVHVGDIMRPRESPRYKNAMPNAPVTPANAPNMRSVRLGNAAGKKRSSSNSSAKPTTCEMTTTAKTRARRLAMPPM